MSSEPPAPFEPSAAWPPLGAPAVLPATDELSAQPAPRSVRLPLITGVAGVTAGALVVGMLWLGTALASGDPEAGADGRMACTILQSLPQLTAGRLDVAYASRVQAAGILAVVATDDDSRFQPIAGDVRAVLQAVQFNDIDAANAHLDTARQACDSL